MIWIIVICIIVYYLYVKSKRKVKEKVNNLLHFTVSSAATYGTILNELQNIVGSVVHSFPGQDVLVSVQVRKLNNVNCRVSFGITLEWSNFASRNISFGNEFTVNNDSARFETNSATGFTTVEAVKGEIARQFKWHDIALSDVKLTVLNYGDYINTPLVMYSFKAKQ